jgi:hypothetical protein
MAHDVFISYSNQDKQVAYAICATLEQQKIRCWIAPRDVPTGANWMATILGAIRQSRSFVLVFSKASNTSDDVEREVRAALDAHVPVLPFKIEDADLSDALQFMLGTLHWLDASRPPLGAQIEELAKSLVGLLQGQPLDAPSLGPRREPNAVAARSAGYPTHASAAHANLARPIPELDCR